MNVNRSCFSNLNISSAINSEGKHPISHQGCNEEISIYENLESLAKMQSAQQSPDFWYQYQYHIKNVSSSVIINRLLKKQAMRIHKHRVNLSFVYDCLDKKAISTIPFFHITHVFRYRSISKTHLNLCSAMTCPFSK